MPEEGGFDFMGRVDGWEHVWECFSRTEVTWKRRANPRWDGKLGVEVG